MKSDHSFREADGLTPPIQSSTPTLEEAEAELRRALPYVRRTHPHLFEDLDSPQHSDLDPLPLRVAHTDSLEVPEESASQIAGEYFSPTDRDLSGFQHPELHPLPSLLTRATSFEVAEPEGAGPLRRESRVTKAGWVCCTCRHNNPSFAPNRCPTDGHYKCRSCYVYR
jgi:hypothetical protein